ncbi:MAG TPA: ribonuclease HII [Nitrososphaerales archaeon]|nr:ribonuclease HII [Nitrososphaerales archaeon]
MLVAGVDDAGRGSVLGPLVIGGVSIDDSKISKLQELGVKDSKLLSAKKRSSLYREIKKIAHCVVHEKIPPKLIDEAVLKGERLYRLNFLEARYMAKVLSRLEFKVAYVDCCDTDQKRFGNLIADLLAIEKTSGRKKSRSGKKNPTHSLGPLIVDYNNSNNPLRQKIVSEHHADRNYAVVSAASIIAKVTRDAAVKRLQKEHGVFGSGYPSDPATIEFLKSFVDSSKSLPPFTRLSWATVIRLSKGGKQAEGEENERRNQLGIEKFVVK